MGVLLPLEDVLGALPGDSSTGADPAAGPDRMRELSPEERLERMMARHGGGGGGRAMPDWAPGASGEQLDAAAAAAPETSSTAVTLEASVRASPAGKFLQLGTKEPVFEKGNYRLNFHGRVKLPSVKNYQLTPSADIADVWTQFGKVTEHEFHLDFKAPLSPLVAFALAITQFDY